MSIHHTLFWLLVGHALADFGLQNDYMSRAKSAWTGHPEWPIVLSGHAAIHAGAVALVTGSDALGCCEFAAHALIDHLKCGGRISYAVDQTLHVLCKLAWVAAVVWL